MTAVLSNWCFLIRGWWLNIKVNRKALRRGKQGFAEVPELEFWNRDKWYFEWHTFIVNITTKRSRYLPCYTHYRLFPNRIVKFILPHHQQTSIHGLSETTGAVQLTKILGEFCLQLFWFDLSMGQGIPVTSHFLVSEERSPLLLRITRLAWKIRTALVDTRAIRAYKIEFHLKV